MLSIVFVFASAVTWSSVAAALWKTADAVDTLASERSREAARKLFRPGLLRDKMTAWAEAFRDAFNAVFTESHWTMQSFRRSCAASLICIGVGTVFLAALNSEKLFRGYCISSGVDRTIHVASVVPNLLIDFVAIWVTRRLITPMQAVRLFATQALLFVALLLSHFVLALALQIINYEAMNRALVIIASFTGRTEAFAPSSMSPFDSARVVWRVITLEESIRPEWFIAAPIIWSTFLTAFWMLLYMASYPVARLGVALGRLVSVATRYIDIERKPFHALALVLVIVWTLLFMFLSWLGYVRTGASPSAVVLITEQMMTFA